MILQPQSLEELSTLLSRASAEGKKVTRVDLDRCARIVEHTPEDMTATVQSGMRLRAFQETIGAAGQWLPIDPFEDDTLTIGELLAHDLSGSRRLGYGTIRDYLLGITVVFGSGELIKAGGKVVKNVAGYDLCKLFIGARHSLGIIVQATFKLRPLPEQECFVHGEFAELDKLAATAKQVLSSQTEPVLLDAHNLNGNYTLIAAFASTREDVEFQVGLAQSLGLSPCSAEMQPAVAAKATRFWTAAPARKISVLPSRTFETVGALKPDRFIAHLGNGIIYYQGGISRDTVQVDAVARLMQRVKSAYDPNAILPEYSA